MFQFTFSKTSDQKLVFDIDAFCYWYLCSAKIYVNKLSFGEIAVRLQLV